MYIEASGRDFETMRKRFIQRLQEYSDKINQANQPLQNGATQVYMPVLFTKYAEEWLSIKKQTTKPSTYKEYERSYNADLKPTFQKKCLHEITRSDLQKYLFGIVDEGKHRKAEKLALMLNCIFDMATDDYGIPSPMKKVVLPNYQTKKGTAFTKGVHCLPYGKFASKFSPNSNPLPCHEKRHLSVSFVAGVDGFASLEPPAK
jgi:hypothetical protein